jgi:hypothetical protein
MAMEPLRFRYRRSGWEQESFRLFAKRGEVRVHSLLLDRRGAGNRDATSIRAQANQLRPRFRPKGQVYDGGRKQGRN